MIKGNSFGPVLESLGPIEALSFYKKYQGYPAKNVEEQFYRRLLNPIPYGLRLPPIPYGGGHMAPLSKIP